MDQTYKELNDQRLRYEGCDLIIRIGDESFFAHREVLMNRLSFFRRKFTVGMLREKESTISLPAEVIDSVVFEGILQYVYLSNPKKLIGSFKSIYPIADYMNFEELLQVVEERMCKKIVDLTKSTADDRKLADNLMILMNIVHEYNLSSIKVKYIDSLIANPLSSLGKEHLVPSLTFGHLKVLLKRMLERMNQSEDQSEEEVRSSIDEMFQLCSQWIEHTDQSDKLVDLLRMIPLACALVTTPFMKCT